MYQIDRKTNRITKVQEVSFTGLGFRERDHLQEWLCNCPDALGEKLLILQKEFDGFNDTRERLDLLALDKNGSLVIIENKLDDSGRDVVWQSLKYASYCSTLSKSQIIEIYQKYLDSEQQESDAASLICDFLEADDFDNVELNTGHEQRIIMVAANFRKEVTSTVLWLMNHGINLKCFRATPLSLDPDNVFLHLEQVIPMKDAEDFMISMAAKEQEKQSIKKVQHQRSLLNQEFWQQTLQAFSDANIDLYKNHSPSKASWMSLGSGISFVSYVIVFAKKYARVELYTQRSTQEENKLIFDALHAKKNELEQRFGFPLVWERLDTKKASRIKYERPFDGANKAIWPEMAQWLAEHIQHLEVAIKPEVDDLWQLLQAHEAKQVDNNTLPTDS